MWALFSFCSVAQNHYAEESFYLFMKERLVLLTAQDVKINGFLFGSAVTLASSVVLDELAGWTHSSIWMVIWLADAVL